MIEPVSKILIIRPDRIGDFVIFSSALKYYRQLFKDYQIHLLVIPQVKPIAENCPYVDYVFCFDPEASFFKTPVKFLKQLKVLRNNFYDKIIYPVYSRNRDEIALLAEGKEKIAFAGNGQSVQRKNNSFFSMIVNPDLEPCKEIERNAEFIKKLGWNSPLELKTQIWFDRDDELKFQRFKNQYGLKEKNYIVLACGARLPIRLWPVEKWVELINRLLPKIADAPILLVGDNNDKKINSKIKSAAGLNNILIDLAGKIDLRLLAKIIENSAMLMGTESAAVHIAAAVETPNVCLMGGGHFGRFYPYGNLEKNRIAYYKMDCFGCNWKCKYQRNDFLSRIRNRLWFADDTQTEQGKCVKSIEVDNVLEQAEYLLETQRTGAQLAY